MRHYAASVGTPSGRSPPFFGIYTRRTGSAGPGPPWRCKNPARLARALEVSATCPPAPGGAAAGVALAHLLHADQRVSPAAQH